MKFVNPGAVFITAERFWKASRILAERMSRGPEVDVGLSAPTVVLGAFAIEVYLKCLYAIEHRGKPAYGHDLLKLFGLLSKASRARIREQYDQEIKTDETTQVLVRYAREHEQHEVNLDLDAVLRDARDAFATWRYSFEGRVSGFVGGPAIQSAIRSRILELAPDLWQAVGERKWPFEMVAQFAIDELHSEGQRQG